MEANPKKFSRDMEVMLPKGFGGQDAVATMFVAPATLMALGAGLAGHAFGLWLNAVSSSLEVAEKLSETAFRGSGEAPDTPTYKAPNSPAKRARAAFDTAAADVAVVAEDALAAGMKAAAEVGNVADTVAQPAPAGPSAAPAAGRDASMDALARPAAIDRPDTIDDLKAISGVGPKLEKVLNGLGIWTYRQIVELSEAEIRWLDEELGFRGRISRDEWLKQAGELAAKR